MIINKYPTDKNEYDEDSAEGKAESKLRAMLSIANKHMEAGASELKALLADIVACRDECRDAEKNLLPAADPRWDARIAFGTVANQLDALIKRHGG